MALRGGGTVPASVNDHAYLYANPLDKSIMYDLAVHWLASPGGSVAPCPRQGCILAPAPSHLDFACSRPSPLPPTSKVSQFTVSLFGSRNLPLWGFLTLSWALPQVRLRPFLKLSTLLIYLFIEHLPTSFYVYTWPNKQTFVLYFLWSSVVPSALHILLFNPNPKEIGVITDPTLQRKRLWYSVV